VIAMETTVYNGTTYSPGQQFTIVTGVLTITSGLVSFAFINSEFPPAIQDEICVKAAALLSQGVQDYQKQVVLENDANKQ
jgi:hypothetical protein